MALTPNVFRRRLTSNSSVERSSGRETVTSPDDGCGGSSGAAAAASETMTASCHDVDDSPHQNTN